MDPFITFADRANRTQREVVYDRRYVYERDVHVPKVKISADEDQSIFADTDILSIFKANKKRTYVGAVEKIVLERANPFYAIPGEYEEVAFRKIFGFPRVTILRPTRNAFSIVSRELLDNEPQNLMVAVDNTLSRGWLHFCYFMTKLYRRVSLLQLAMSETRYLVCLDFSPFEGNWEGVRAERGQDIEVERGQAGRTETSQDIKTGKERAVKTQTWRDVAIQIVRYEAARELSSIFTTLPQSFVSWFVYMNNVHIARLAQLMILISAQKEAYDGGGIFTGMPSYDIRKVASYLRDEDLKPKAVQSKTFSFSDIIDEEFVYGLHLFGEPQRFQGSLHTEINMETDQRLKYEPGRKLDKGGIHWGQRKLLMSEIDFFTRFLDPNEIGVCFYIGASPFDHGPALFEMFPNLRFILVDPADRWHTDVRAAVKTGTVMIKTEWFNDEFMEKLKSELFGAPYSRIMSRAIKFFFISDIRSTSHTEKGGAENEKAVDADMKNQLRYAKALAELVGGGLSKDEEVNLKHGEGEAEKSGERGAQRTGLQFYASFKFRMPYLEEIGGPDYAYAGGILTTQAWSRLKSAELRLFWTPVDGEKTYNKVALEDIMMYHNTILREVSFGDPGEKGYCECHDCHYEIHLLKKYIAKFKAKVNIDSATLFNGHVLLLNKVFGKTLEAHSEVDRKRAKVFIIDKYTNGALRYDVEKERVRSNITFASKARLLGVLKKLVVGSDVSEGVSGSSKKREVVERKLEDLITHTLLYNLFATGEISFLPSAEVISETLDTETGGVSSLARGETGGVGIKIERHEDILKAFRDTEEFQDAELTKAFKAIKDVTEVKSNRLGRDVKGFYNISTFGEKPSATISFHKSVFKLYLKDLEEKYDVPDAEIRKKPAILARVFSHLKRLGVCWHDHLAYSIEETLEAHGLHQYLNGVSLLGVGMHGESVQKRGEEGKETGQAKKETQQTRHAFGALVPDLELQFTDEKSISMAKDPIMSQSSMTIFAPPLRSIWKLYISRVVAIMKKYDGSDKTIALIIPRRFLDLIPADLDKYEKKVEIGDVDRATNVIQNKEVEIEPHAVKVFTSLFH